jgi:hypothetical protein
LRLRTLVEMRLVVHLTTILLQIYASFLKGTTQYKDSVYIPYKQVIDSF